MVHFELEEWVLPFEISDIVQIMPRIHLSGIGKENNETLNSAKKTKKRNPKSKELEKSFEKELQGKFEELRVEKEKADELVKVCDEMLKQKEEEIESHGKE
ncbi:hypothetical protein GIB67_036745 [Kingdonia uniflora]|uniref:Uncharacterized protein n=1 Tax=Kingdonia uniflora TaxID=39325 RepID=A0A7J7LWK0_9MAGN|nr:hypothetical protein GIB67_036745 [Kingdonia uniflora]